MAHERHVADLRRRKASHPGRTSRVAKAAQPPRALPADYRAATGGASPRSPAPVGPTNRRITRPRRAARLGPQARTSLVAARGALRHACDRDGRLRHRRICGTPGCSNGGDPPLDQRACRWPSHEPSHHTSLRRRHRRRPPRPRLDGHGRLPCHPLPSRAPSEGDALPGEGCGGRCRACRADDGCQRLAPRPAHRAACWSPWRWTTPPPTASIAREHRRRETASWRPARRSPREARPASTTSRPPSRPPQAPRSSAPSPPSTLPRGLSLSPPEQQQRQQQ